MKRNFVNLWLFGLLSMFFLSIPSRAADPDQLYDLSQPAFACDFQDDIELADRYAERNERDMFEYMVKKGHCRIDESGLRVKIIEISKYRPLCIKVAPLGSVKPFWVFASSIMGYADNVVIPEAIAKNSALGQMENEAASDPEPSREIKESLLEKLISERKIYNGMTQGQVIRAWGKPLSKESRLESGGTADIWTYSQEWKIVFRHERVTEIRQGK